MFCLKRDKAIKLPEYEEPAYVPTDVLLSTVLGELDQNEKALLPITRPGEAEMAERLSSVRDQIKEAKVDWYVVTSEDEHGSEEVAVSDKRREWISNFTGSAGTALIPSSSIDAKALLFVDSRYWSQAEEQAPKEGWKVQRVGDGTGSGPGMVASGWLDYVVNELEDGSRVGIDPKLISNAAALNLQAHLLRGKTELVPIKVNLVDKVHSPPARSLGPLTPYPATLAGEVTKTKLTRMRAKLHAVAHSDDWIYLIPTLTTLTWLLNYRCRTDIPFCPVAFAYAVLTPDKCVLFVDPRKVRNQELLDEWAQGGIQTRPYGVDEVEKFVKEVAAQVKARDEKAKPKILASNDSSWALISACAPIKVETIVCPIQDAKALKNPTELQNFRNAYLRDGRAMVRWFAWVEQRLIKEEKELKEWDAAAVLTRYRRKEDMFSGLAYDDISASGPNGASPHYVPTRQTQQPIDIDAPYVIDSGPQYLDATIDTTRTWFFGKTPTDDMKRAYTRVVQGHIAVASQAFPRGTDAFALGSYSKKFLWEDGLDYGHGLGHGVGNYGAVHEAPVFFQRGFSFQPTHVTTIEPGCYLEGQYGIRVESVYICKEVEVKYPREHHWLGFECVTRVPIDTRMIDWTLTTKSEIRWINAYNTMVQDDVLPLLDDDDFDGPARDWIKRVCKPKIILPWTGA